MAGPMSIILFSGTADKLQAAATMVSGAAAMEVETHLFLTFWGLNAFRKDMITTQQPMSPEYGEFGAMLGKLMVEKQVTPWHDVLRTAKEIGDVRVHACAMTADLMDLTLADFDPLVDDMIGVAGFIESSRDGQVLFI